MIGRGDDRDGGLPRPVRRLLRFAELHGHSRRRPQIGLRVAPPGLRSCSPTPRGWRRARGRRRSVRPSVRGFVLRCGPRRVAEAPSFAPRPPEAPRDCSRVRRRGAGVRHQVRDRPGDGARLGGDGQRGSERPEPRLPPRVRAAGLGSRGPAAPARTRASTSKRRRAAPGSSKGRPRAPPRRLGDAGRRTSCAPPSARAPSRRAPSRRACLRRPRSRRRRPNLCVPRGPRRPRVPSASRARRPAPLRTSRRPRVRRHPLRTPPLRRPPQPSVRRHPRGGTGVRSREVTAPTRRDSRHPRALGGGVTATARALLRPERGGARGPGDPPAPTARPAPVKLERVVKDATSGAASAAGGDPRRPPAADAGRGAAAAGGHARLARPAPPRLCRHARPPGSRRPHACRGARGGAARRARPGPAGSVRRPPAASAQARPAASAQARPAASAQAGAAAAAEAQRAAFADARPAAPASTPGAASAQARPAAPAQAQYAVSAEARPAAPASTQGAASAQAQRRAPASTRARRPPRPGPQRPPRPGAAAAAGPQRPPRPRAQRPRRPDPQRPRKRGLQRPPNLGAQRARRPSAQCPPTRGQQRPPRPGAQRPRRSRPQRPPRPGRSERQGRGAAGAEPRRNAHREPRRNAHREPRRNAHRGPRRRIHRGSGRNIGRGPGRRIHRRPSRHSAEGPGRNVRRGPGAASTEGQAATPAEGQAQRRPRAGAPRPTEGQAATSAKGQGAASTEGRGAVQPDARPASRPTAQGAPSVSRTPLTADGPHPPGPPEAPAASPDVTPEAARGARRAADGRVESDAAPVVARARVTRTPRGAADDRAAARPRPVRPRIAREAPATEASHPPRPVAWVRTPVAEPGAAVPTARPATPAPQRSPLRRAFDGLRRPAADATRRPASPRCRRVPPRPAAFPRAPAPRRSDPESRAAGPHGRAGSGSYAIPPTPPAQPTLAQPAPAPPTAAQHGYAATQAPVPVALTRLPHPPRRPPSPAPRSPRRRPRPARNPRRRPQPPGPPARRSPEHRPAPRSPQRRPALRSPRPPPALRSPHHRPALRSPHHRPALRRPATARTLAPPPPGARRPGTAGATLARAEASAPRQDLVGAHRGAAAAGSAGGGGGGAAEEGAAAAAGTATRPTTTSGGACARSRNSSASSSPTPSNPCQAQTPFTSYYFQLKLPDLDTSSGRSPTATGSSSGSRCLRVPGGRQQRLRPPAAGARPVPEPGAHGLVTDEDALLKWFWATHTQAERKEITLTLKTPGQDAHVDVRRRVPGQLDAARSSTPTALGCRDRDARDRPQRAEDGLDDAHPPGIPAREARDRRARNTIECAFNPPELHGLARPTSGTSSRRPGIDLPDGEFGGGLPRRTTLCLLLDVSLLAPDQSVKDTANKLLKMMETDGGGGGGGVGAAVRDVPLGLGRPAEVGAGLPDDPVRRSSTPTASRSARPSTSSSPRPRRPTPPPPGTSQGQNPTTRAMGGLRVHRVRDGDTPALDRLRRLRRPDALARRSPRPTASTTRCSLRRGTRAHDPEARLAMPATSKEHVALYTIIGRRRRARRRSSATASRRSASSTTCACPTCARSRITYPRREGIDTHPFDIGEHARGPARRQRGAGDRRRCSRATSSRSSRRSAPAAVALLVRAYDRAHLLHRSRSVRTFQNQTSTDIVAKIVGEHGLSFQGDGQRRRPTTSCSRTTRPTGTSSGGWPSASASSSSSRTARRTSASRAAATRSSSSGRRRCSSFSPRVTAVQQVQ